MQQKGFINIFIIVAFVIGLTVAGYLAWSQKSKPAPQASDISSATTTPVEEAPIPDEIIPIPVDISQAASSSAQVVQSTSGTVSVDFGQDFILKKGQTARIKGQDISLVIKNFINSPCPKGAQCIWSGLAVVYELRINGKVYDADAHGGPPPMAPYDVIVKESDYKTYAKFLIGRREVN